MDGLQLRWSRQHFLRVHSSRTKWYVKYGYAISVTIRRLIQTQQFVLLIQQVQAPEDLAVALPIPLPLPIIPPPQAGSLAQPPSPSENTPIAPANAMPAGSQNTNATAPSQQGASFLSILRFIFQLAWYDDHSRICTYPLHSSLLPDERAFHRVPHTHRARPRRARRGRAGARSSPPRGALLIHLGTADCAGCAPWAAVHAWAKVRHRDDSGAYVTRSV